MAFDLTSYKVTVPGSMFLEVSGNGKYQSTYDAEAAYMDPAVLPGLSYLVADFVFTTSTGDGSDELTVDVETDLEFESAEFDEAGSPIAGALTISADDNSQVVVSPADVSGIVNIDLTAADGTVSRDTRSWFEFTTINQSVRRLLEPGAYWPGTRHHCTLQ